MHWMISFKNRKDRMPIFIINIYVCITLFLYVFGPVKFNCDASIWMVLYVLLFLIVINIGYYTALYNYSRRDLMAEKETTTFDFNKPLPLAFQIIGLLIPTSMLLGSIALAGFNGFSGGLSNAMAEAYTFNQSGGRIQDGIDIPMWIYMHCALFVYLSIIDGVVYFRTISLRRKIILLLTVCALGAYFMMFKGTQKTLGDIFILISSAILVFIYNNGIYRRINKKIIGILIVLAILFAAFLATIMAGRINYLNGIGYDAFRLHTTFWDVNLDSLLLAPFKENMKVGIACLTFYLCNGLCGLAYCLKTNFTWSYGLGGFTDLSDILERRFGFEIFHSTYPYRAYEEYGWHYGEQWHSVFPWLASDWTYIGALLILGAIAYIYAICWEDILHGVYKESIYLFCILNILWIFVPANNQLMSTRTTALVFIICLYMWSKRRHNARRKRLFYER